MADTIKIVRVITRLNVGGPSIHAILLSSELTRAGYTDLLVFGKSDGAEGDMGYLAKDKGLTPLFVEDLRRDITFLKDIRAFFALFSIMRKVRPDIVHTHMAKAGALGRLAAVFAGVPVKIHTFHGHIFDGYFSSLKTKIFIRIERMMARFTDKLIVVSEAVRDELVGDLKVMKEDKSVVIPLGIELDRFMNCESMKGSFRSARALDPDVLSVGIVGRLVPIKNHIMFLEAAGKLRQKAKGLKIKFFIIGDGESRGFLEEYVRSNGLLGMVEFTGWIKDLAGVYADLDIVCLTSLNEGTPVSLIEALASARAVIATDVGGVRDVITDGVNGVLVRSRDVDTFADRLLELLNDPARRADLGAHGRMHVRQRYSKERLVKDIENLYTECLRKKQRPCPGTRQ